MKVLRIPESEKNNEKTIQIEKNMVIVGANWAWKTRLGSKLEHINNPSRRISAQRYLQLNEVVQKQDFVTAKKTLEQTYKRQPPIQPQNDFQQVLISLFAEEWSRDSSYIRATRESSEEKKLPIPQSIKEKVIDIWSFVFPYRKLILENDRVRADTFAGSEMSDWEKVWLYLISQTLLAEQDCILIIDEPELHLHKSLMVRLWNKLEEYRSDCTFIYITHDLDFAVTKPSSKLIWVKQFNNNTWNWLEVSPNEIIPENLYLEILWSRRPILFVEWEQGSLDMQIYQAYYEDFTIIPCGSCEKVIESVKGFKNNEILHDKNVYGLIDRDFRTDEQLEKLKKKKVYSTSVNKVENLFLVQEVIAIVCDYLKRPEAKNCIIQEIRNEYKTKKEDIAFLSAKYLIWTSIYTKVSSIKSKYEYEQLKTVLFDWLDNYFTSFVLPDDNSDIADILKIYPKKGLINKIQNKIDLKWNGYKSLVLGFLSSEKREDVVNSLKKYLPEII